MAPSLGDQNHHKPSSMHSHHSAPLFTIECNLIRFDMCSTMLKKSNGRCEEEWISIQICHCWSRIYHCCHVCFGSWHLWLSLFLMYIIYFSDIDQVKNREGCSQFLNQSPQQVSRVFELHGLAEHHISYFPLHYYNHLSFFFHSWLLLQKLWSALRCVLKDSSSVRIYSMCLKLYPCY